MAQDQDPAADESQERAISSEPSSTKGSNPYMETDLPSPKRRRTSRSGPSRSRSIDSPSSVRPSNNSPAISSANPVPESQTDLDIMETSNGTEAPTPANGPRPATPEPNGAQPEPSSGSRSNRVTINVRTPRPLETIPSSPASAFLQNSQEPLLSVNNVQASVEVPEVDMTRDEAIQDALPSPVSDASSPAIEVAMEKEEEDAFTVMDSIADAVPEFPFHEEHETYQDTMEKLAPLLDDQVGRNVALWIRDFLNHVKNAPISTVAGCYARCSDLWHSLPTLVTAWQDRRHLYQSAKAIKHEPFALYQQFAKLTALWVQFDVHRLKECATVQEREHVQIVSLAYMCVLATLANTEGLYTHPDEEGWTYSAEAFRMMEAFLNYGGNPATTVLHLGRLTQLLAELLPQNPRFINKLVCVSVLTWAITKEASSRAENATRQAHELFTSILSSVYLVYQTLSPKLEAIVTGDDQKHLLWDPTLRHLNTLTWIYQQCVTVEGAIPMAERLRLRQGLNRLSSRYLPEALAYLWKFRMYSTLIMSGQMQLRIRSASGMGADLVQFHRRYNCPPDDSSVPFLKHIAGYLMESGLVSYILGPKCHPEVTLESSNIVGFLAVTRTYTADHTDLTFHTIQSTQDPRISSALINMVNKIVHIFEPPELLYFCTKLEAMPLDFFNSTMREFCGAVLNHLVEKVERIGTNPTPYSLCVRLVRDSAVFGSQSRFAHPETHHFAIQKFSDLLRQGLTQEIRMQIYQECLRDISVRTPFALGSLWILARMTRSSAGRELRMLANDHDLVRIFIDEFEAAIPTARAAGFPAVISGYATTPRRDLLAWVLGDGSPEIPSDTGPKLWNLLVGAEAACEEDRIAGWKLLQDNSSSTFASTCFTEFLPLLAPEFFTLGTIDFIRTGILSVIHAPRLLVEEPDSIGHFGIEQLWRIILSVPEGSIEKPAIDLLVGEVYMGKSSTGPVPLPIARQLHLALAERCLDQLISAAKKLRCLYLDLSSRMSGMEDRTTLQQQVRDQERLCVRSLAVLTAFHWEYKNDPKFSVPDLRALSLDPPKQIEGDSAELKYQSFDGESQTDVIPLSIGKLNTASSLFGSLREATGFGNYRMYYRGRTILPREEVLCMSLEELRIHDGLILVKREADDAAASPGENIRSGTSPVEVVILRRFEELYECMTMEKISEGASYSIYNLLSQLPPNENILKLIDEPSATHRDIFPADQPIKSKYSMYALRIFLTPEDQGIARHRLEVVTGDNDLTSTYSKTLLRGLHIVVGAILDENMTRNWPSHEMQLEFIFSLVESFMLILQHRLLPHSATELIDATLLDRLVNILLDFHHSESEERIPICLHAILEACSMSPELMNTCFEHQGIPKLLEDILLHDQRTDVRRSTKQLLLRKFDADAPKQMRGVAQVSESSDVNPETSSKDENPYRAYLWPVLSDFVPSAMSGPCYPAEFFGLCQGMLRTLMKSKSPLVDAEKLSQQWIGLLLEYKTFEDPTQPSKVDVAVSGLIGLIWEIVTGPHHLGDTLAGVARKLFWAHLYPPLGTNEAESFRPIITDSTRDKLWSIILILVGEDVTQLSWLIGDLKALTPPRPDPEYHPYLYEIALPYERERVLRSSSGYVGLKNLSNTCYFNSLLTQLYMNTDFREYILKSSIRNPYSESQKLLYEMQRLFAFMQNSIRRFASTEDCIGNIRTYEDTVIDVTNQMDVDEFYNLLFDRWEGQFPNTAERFRFRSFYGGQLVQQVASKECTHVSERLEPFSAIQCDIKGKSTLQESLQAYVDGEIMEGDNKYKCSECNRHVDAVKRACLKDIPDNLIFHLKRFDFNLRTLQRSKINDYFEFPDKIDMRPYTMEHLKNPDEDQQEDVFELVGVLVHSGTAESGHYYSYIRERPSRSEQPVWVEYNDDTVTSFDPSQLENACFGGPDYRSGSDHNGMHYEKSYSAYMLFYERSSSLARKQQKLGALNEASPLRVDMQPYLKPWIAEDNTNLVRRHCMFDPYHTRHVCRVLELMKQLNENQCTPDHAIESEALTMALSHLDQVASKLKDLQDFHLLSDEISQLSRDCPESNLAMLRCCSGPYDPLRMLLQRNGDVDVRRKTLDFLTSAIRVVKEQLPSRYGLPSQDGNHIDTRDSAIGHIMALFETLFMSVHITTRSWPEVFGLMVAFVKLGRYEMASFLKRPFLEYLMKLIMADPNLRIGQPFQRLAMNLARRTKKGLPDYTMLICLLDILLASMQIEDDNQIRITVGRPEVRFQSDPWLEQPFLYTQVEANLLEMMWDKSQANIFVEKLIGIYQNIESTHRIIHSLVKQSRWLEEGIFNTLIAHIDTQSQGQFIYPFLHASLVFCRHAPTRELVERLIEHVCEQCRVVESPDGAAFLEFQRVLFDARRESQDDEAVALQVISLLPDWAPGLLGHFDIRVSSDTERFLHEKLFQYGPSPSFGDSEHDQKRADCMKRTGKRLGIRCLQYLRDNIVETGVEVSARLVQSLERVIDQCTRYFPPPGPEDDEEAKSFRRLVDGMAQRLQALKVDEVEDDGSEWENSSDDSEQLDEVGDDKMPTEEPNEIYLQ
ncbi:hypothetical protein B0T20DRAFT_488983 [Sordaria brevicollis]|uniref:USP domain-containing protein n=1 Tax=Sordaria brevicollis TaxID=83679 RepID=A0AAE0P281_SORBR|nr:hypothetical protein B0T20DRAFT_488983 [Sordaria brevicollis]